MPKYLVQGSYSSDGSKGLLKEGGSSRRAHITELVTNLGGRIESFYYAFGESDVILIVEAPDSGAVAALSLAVNASGAVAIRTTPLISPEEIDDARKRTVRYRPPGAPQ